MNNQNQEQTLPAELNLPGITDLLKRTFSVYKTKLGTFLGIIIFPTIFNYFSSVYFLPILIIILLKEGFVAFFLLFIVYFLIIAIISLWSNVSLIFAIKNREEKIGIIESFRRGWSKIISIVWISFLIGIIIGGGYMLFIIPGIIFSIWFVFSGYVLVSENLKGMNALFRSKQLVTGYWWKVLWRFLAMGIILFIPIIFLYTILTVATSAFLADLVVRTIFALFVFPFILVFGFLLYEDLKKQKAQIPFEPPKKGTKIKFILIAIAGFLLIMVIQFLLLSMGEVRKRFQEAEIMDYMRQFLFIAEMIYSEEGSYANVNCSHSKLIFLCNNAKDIIGKEPIIHSSSGAYCIYVQLPDRKYYCLDNRPTTTKTTTFPGNPGYCDGTTFICPMEDIN